MAFQPFLACILAIGVAPGFCTDAIAAPAQTPAKAPQRSSYWREKTSFFKAFGQPADVVMIGDSLTDGAEWREMFPGEKIANRGIDSDTTAGVLARLDEILAIHPKQAFLMVGINDFADAHRKVDAVFSDYRAIVARLEQGGVKVVVQSTLPCNVAKGRWKACGSLNGKIAQLNARLATLASANVSYVDLWPALAGKGGLRGEFTEDGVHLNGEGYRQWKNAIGKLMPGASRRPRLTP